MSAPVNTNGGGLAGALDVLLDKGLVIDATISVSIIGIEILSIQARIVIASVDTYIRFLEAMQRLNAAQNAAPGHIAQSVTSHSTALTYGIAGPLGAPAPATPIAQGIVPATPIATQSTTVHSTGTTPPPAAQPPTGGDEPNP